ncbi:hypothetical protein N2M06_08150 [Oceanimonas sp. AH20CE76]|uniref:hypothetical protein n=1 Tax=Oceanimonas sp. AH20CE76 TaxID=2977120 RepID=UPI0031FE5649
MKKFYAFSIFSILVASGCASNPSVNSGADAEEYAANIYGKEYNFITKDVVLIPELDGSHDDEYGLYGLRLAFKPFSDHCQQDGGQLRALEKKSFSGYDLPTQLHCIKQGELIWGIKQGYSNSHKYYAKTTSTPWYFTTLKPVYYTVDRDVEVNGQNNWVDDDSVISYCAKQAGLTGAILDEAKKENVHYKKTKTYSQLEFMEESEPGFRDTLVNFAVLSKQHMSRETLTSFFMHACVYDYESNSNFVSIMAPEVGMECDIFEGDRRCIDNVFVKVTGRAN